MKTEVIELQAADGHRLAAFVARPDGTPRGVLVVVQEIFGVNPHIRSVAQGYAADGYVAIAPALFDRLERGVELGYEGADRDRAVALKAASSNDAALLDIAAALAHGHGQGRAAIVGYCWGGLLAWLAACRLDSLSAAIAYYGGMPQQAALKARCPVQAHFGEQDTHIPVDAVRAFVAVQPAVELHLYPGAGHGFNCDHRAAFEPASAALARQRALDFLRRHVG